MASAIIGPSAQGVNAPENRLVGQPAMTRQVRSYGWAGISRSIEENGFNALSVQKDGVSSLQPSCGSPFRPPVNTNQPFTNYK
jgi:hypothetical protein